MAEGSISVSIGKTPASSDDLARILGESAADVLGLYLSVIDREDRLESGTGEWLNTFRGEPHQQEEAARQSVLRALRTATDAINYRVLQLLGDGGGVPVEDLVRTSGLSRLTLAERIGGGVLVEDLVRASGLSRLTLAERIGDLVSAGLAAKLPEANQVVGTPAGSAIVRTIEMAAVQATKRMT